MEFTTQYEITERPWWGVNFTAPATVQHLLDDLAVLHSKVQAAAADPAMEEFLSGFATYHRIMYLREILIGEDIVPRGTTKEYLEGW